MAASLALAVKRELGIESVLTGSSKMGAFEVLLDGELMFSKLQSDRFPSHEEIIEVLKKTGRE
jgi:selT/selW/selH-like putative selenoprotein